MHWNSNSKLLDNHHPVNYNLGCGLDNQALQRYQNNQYGLVYYPQLQKDNHLFPDNQHPTY